MHTLEQVKEVLKLQSKTLKELVFDVEKIKETVNDVPGIDSSEQNHILLLLDSLSNRLTLISHSSIVHPDEDDPELPEQEM